MQTNERHPIGAVVALLICAAGWSMAPVFIRMLREAYDPITQGCIRYGCGSAFLLALCWIYHREELIRLFRDPMPLIAFSVLNVFQQCVWTMGTYGSTATTAQLVVKLNVVFVIIFAYILFHEERAVIRNPMYLLGTALSIGGVGAVLMRDAGQFRPTFDTASVLLLVTALSWAVYAVWGKHLVKGRQPIAMFAVVATFTTIGLAVLSVAFGTPGDVLQAGGATTVLMIVSGIVAIGGAHPAFHYAQRHFGSAFTNTFILVTPAMTYAASFVLLPGETLNRTQLIGGAVLISGTLLITITENHQRRRASRALAVPNFRAAPEQVS